MFSPKPSGKWKWRHLILFWKFENQERFLHFTRNINFCSNIWILSRDPIPSRWLFYRLFLHCADTKCKIFEKCVSIIKWRINYEKMMRKWTHSNIMFCIFAQIKRRFTIRNWIMWEYTMRNYKTCHFSESFTFFNGELGRRD